VTRREALSHPLAFAGVVITTVAGVLFITLLLAAIAGMLTNPYAGLVVFVALPALFVMGLLLIPVGVRIQRRALLRDPNAVADWPVVDLRVASVRRTTLLIVALTAANIVIVLLAGYGGLHWMESPSFCGQACHTPMQPQFTAWRVGPHARVACVDCHIGEGAKGFIHAKAGGVRQLIEFATHSYSTPVPPGAKMPPGAQARTCGACHEPGRPMGDRLRVVREYADDEANAETVTILQMHVGSVASARSPGPAIHRHADPGIRIEYVATDAERKTIPYVKVTDASGQVREYRAPDTTEQMIREGTLQTMDCVDCHNTVGHPMAQTPERAIDQAMAAQPVSRGMPFIRREGVRLVKASYPSADAAERAIDEGLRGFYGSRGGAIDQTALAQSVAAVQNAYRRNVFPAMKVTFGSYPDNKGHVTSDGCFRCHDDSHTSSGGKTISADCELCHTQIDAP
jgi:NapC/NirT cytochrome c family, N-terminal region